MSFFERAKGEQQSGPETIFRSISAEDLSAVLKDSGYLPEISKRSDGNPIIKFEVFGLRTVVFFFAPKDGAYEGFQFFAGFSLQNKPGQAKMNDWNVAKRFAKAYVDSDGDPTLEMDVDLEGGVTREFIAARIRTWRSVLGAFARHIGYV